MGDVQDVLGWNPPSEMWRPGDWEASSYDDSPVDDVWTEEDLNPPEPASPSEEGEWHGMGDEGSDPWGRGFYAIGCSHQPRFYLLIVAYWEGRAYTYTGPGMDEIFQYRLFTVGLDGKLIDQQDLFSGGRERDRSGYSGPETYRESGESLLLQPDLSFAIKTADNNDGSEMQAQYYRVDKDGHVNAIE